MRVLVTGHRGYIGPAVVEALRRAGHEVVGLDSFWFEGCDFGPPPEPVPELRADIRGLTPGQLDGFDAIAHLAAVSNDPVGELAPDTTYEINHRATARLGELAREAGVGRFVFSSSCSLYGAAGDAELDETADFNPVTAYGHSKVLAEQDLARLATDSFSPVFLRNATAYGVSPYLRGDLVVNNLVGVAFTTGEVLIKSDGTPWRPLVHIRDIARAFVAALEAPVERVHCEAFNVGDTRENYQIREIATMVEGVVPGSRVAYAPDGGPDLRCYRVDCAKIAERLGFSTGWTVPSGIEELYAAFEANGLTEADLTGPRFVRIERIKELQREGSLDASLRWRERSETVAG